MRPEYYRFARSCSIPVRFILILSLYVLLGIESVLFPPSFDTEIF
jgi:hypothetical protein